MNEQVKTPHFWIGLIAIGIPAAMEAGLVPSGSVYERVGRLLMALLTYAGIQSAAKWMPARVIEKLDEHSAAKLALAAGVGKAEAEAEQTK